MITIPRLAWYGATSTLLAATVVGSAVHTRPNFFAAAVAVGRSSGSLMVLANFALFNTICIGIAIKKIFFGQLRPIEYEHLFERLWVFLTESLLALTIFRDDFSIGFAFMYSVLLFLKCFHWITADRVDYMDQVPPPGPPLSFHIRIFSITSLLTTVDFLLVAYSLETITFHGVSSMVLFASEFMILLGSIWGTSARYAINVIDIRRARGRADAPSWEAKSMYLFYIDLAVDFIKLLTYFTFFLVILMHYGLPIHILRDVYMTARSFVSRCSDLVRYRRATRDMDALYPNATAEDMARSDDRTCIICREEMVAQTADTPPSNDGPNETPKKLQCGHIFHFHCLRSWLERQQSCPTCRRDVLTTANPRPGVRAAPPPPAPGQAPRHPQQQQQGPGGPDNPFPNFQNLYNQFFQPPANNQQPFPPPAQNGAAPAPTPTPTVQNPANGSPATQPQDQAPTGSIWGGFVHPGQFTATPLGAGPSNRPFPTYNFGQTAPTPTAPTAQAGPSTIVPPTEPRLPTRSVPPAGVSGSTTPFSSNPPEVFAPTSVSRELSRTPPGQAGPLGTSSTTASDIAESTRSDITQQEPSPADEAGVSEADRRRTAAEAAMRRLGQNGLPQPRVTRSRSRQETSEPSPVSSPLLEVPDPTQSMDKGKGKAEEGPSDLLTDPPRHIPYLTSNLPVPSWYQQGLDRAGLSEHTREGTRSALDERLRVLREFDERLYGLLGDMTRLKSTWEAEDELKETANGFGV